LKFSGKERESKSEMDYFGARYYDHLRYRFISVDPVINKKEALVNPQLWNLYSYCKNNPVFYLDPDGRIVRTTSEGLDVIRKSIGDNNLANNIALNNGIIQVNDVQSDNSNFNSLKSLVGSNQQIEVSITDMISFTDRSSGTKYKNIAIGNGINGIVISPQKGRSDAVVVHDSDSLLVAVARSFYRYAPSLQAKVLAHELYGHAYLYISNKPFQHELTADRKGTDTNGFVNQYIWKIEERKY
jgi:RHS repeat-associated protein